MGVPVINETPIEPGNILVNNKPAHVGHAVNRPVKPPIPNNHFSLFFGLLLNANAISITFQDTSAEIMINNNKLTGIKIAPMCSVM